MHYLTAYPATPAARDRFVLDLRGPRPRHEPWHYQNLSIEDEPTARGDMARVGTVFLTGRECPWRCAMCDLWRFTTREDTPAGAIPAQVGAARRAWEATGETIARIKLYNASNFFDPRAVPEHDYAAIASHVSDLDHVIVESHPSLVGDRVGRFLDALRGPALEVAMGLETVHPVALESLNKRMTTDDFAAAAARLRAHGVSVRAFVLISPPFIPQDEQDEWLVRTVTFAEQCGASIISLIPARTGNGAMERLTAQQLFSAPSDADVARSHALAVASLQSPARVLLDPWSANAH